MNGKVGTVYICVTYLKNYFSPSSADCRGWGIQGVEMRCLNAYLSFLRNRFGVIEGTKASLKEVSYFSVELVCG